ncbi:hypothetical protein CHISP_3652 [Chitinispirillum alkaliphilum]|nr:hypothetical protein CHISP_3652 [Chitinispirillum alkaliphilum]
MDEYINIESDTIKPRSSSTHKEVQNEFREKGMEMARSKKGAVVGEMENICNALHAASEQLHDKNDYFAKWVDMAAEKVDSACEFVKKEEPEDVVSAVKDLSHKNPYLAIGGMFFAGLALSRFLKAGDGKAISKEE